MTAAASLLPGDPTQPSAAPTSPISWLGKAAQTMRSRRRHRPEADAEQIQFHYDVSDEFYALWLDPRRIYSCAYFRDAGMSIAQAQEAKLEHICTKLMLKEGERFLDIGAGWGGLLLFAAEHYGVKAQGITLSKNQHAYVNKLVAERGLAGKVRMDLVDYRHLDESAPFDKIASIGMFEHVGKARLPEYFAKINRLLKPGGLLLNHGITAGGTQNHQLGSGLGDFIEKYIFPGGELEHVSHVLATTADAGLEAVDVESLRPHYAKTLWAWSDSLEAQLPAARTVTTDTVLRAYRLYLAGSAMCFRAGVALALPDALRQAHRRPRGRPDARRTIGIPVQPRLHVSASLMYVFKSKADADLIMMEPVGRPDPAHPRARAGQAGNHRGRRAGGRDVGAAAGDRRCRSSARRQRRGRRRGP